MKSPESTPTCIPEKLKSLFDLSIMRFLSFATKQHHRQLHLAGNKQTSKSLKPKWCRMGEACCFHKKCNKGLTKAPLNANHPRTWRSKTLPKKKNLSTSAGQFSTCFLCLVIQSDTQLRLIFIMLDSSQVVPCLPAADPFIHSTSGEPLGDPRDGFLIARVRRSSRFLFLSLSFSKSFD